MEILDTVWPLTIVDESNLRFQIACLRKALGEDCDLIKTISGRGYIFVGNVVSGKQGRSRDVNRDPSPDADSPHASMGYEQAHNSASTKNVPAPDGPDVVIIDDDDGVREALTDLLNSFGFSVEAYPEVQSLLSNPNRRCPKCMVLDILMPGQNGLDFQADLKRRNERTPIIFISGHADVPMSVRAMKAGAIEFLTKPVRHEDLLTAIRSAVQGGALHR
jgi:DNA-binding response OmpR family regulator